VKQKPLLNQYHSIDLKNRSTRQRKKRWFAIATGLTIVLTLFSTPILAATDCTQVEEIPQIECAALLALYNSTDGANWTDSPSNQWNVTNTPCSWTGVSCALFDNMANVTAINRPNKGLNGSIPSALGNLSHLTHLHLWQNTLSGTIPIELGNLDNLQQLDLSVNQLSGAIPSKLGNLTNLEFFNLHSNQLRGSILPEFGNMTLLTTLGLGNNNLTGNIPVELGNLSNLTELGLSQNELTGSIPTALGNLNSLTKLSLWQNKLTGTIPTELGNLNSLETLNLNDNQLLCGEVPSSFSATNLPALTNLNLANNFLSASDVNVISFLDNDKFAPGWTRGWETQQTPTDEPSCPNAIPLPPTGFSATAFSATQINLDWTDNSENETGFIIERNGDLIEKTDADVVSFEDTDLTCGTEYSYTVKATNTYGDSEPATAEATTLSCPPSPPSEPTATVDSRTKITFSWVDNSDDETGFVIERNGDLIEKTDADVVSFEDTDLTCDTPYSYTVKATNANGDSETITATATTSACIKGCEKVTAIPRMECEALLALYNDTDGANWLDSPDNQWNTTNPPCSWTGVTCTEGNVTAINLPKNQLHGSLPAELENLPNLTELVLTNNQLEGYIPTELTNLNKLKKLLMFGNQLSGVILPKLGNLSDLEQLNLGKNQFTGSIPAELANLTNLKSLNLAQNQLTGTIPTELGNLSNLISLILSNNEITGNIPTELRELSKLEILRLSSNQLSGTIPASLGNLSNLTTIILSNNQLDGSIPTDLENWEHLTTLILFSNQLSGDIPSSFNASSLPRLVEFELACNKLTVSDESIIDFLDTFSPGWTDGWENKQSGESSCSLLSSSGDNIDKLSPSVIYELTPEQLDVLDPKLFKQRSSREISKLFTNVDANKIKPADVEDLVPPDWTLDPDSGALTAPVGSKLTLQALPPAKLPSQVEVPLLPELDVGFGLGGAGTPIVDGIDESLAVSELEDLVPVQDDTGILHVESAEIMASVIPDVANIQVVNNKVSTGLSFSEGGFYQLTMSNALRIRFIPVPKDLEDLSKVLGNGKVALGNSGDVLMDIPSSSRRRKTRRVVIFDPFIKIKPASDDLCVEITPNYIICDFTPSFHILKRNTRIRQTMLGVLIYNDGTFQTVKPTLLFPKIFIREGLKFKGVEKIAFNANGTFYVLYRGKGFLIIPTFEIKSQFLAVEKSLKPSIVVNANGTLRYTVAIGNKKRRKPRTTRGDAREDREVLIFDSFIEPADDCMESVSGEIICDYF